MISKHTLKTFKRVPLVVTGFFADIPVSLLDVRRNADAWTAREHLYHIVDVQEMLLGRIGKIRDEEHPVIEPFFPENEEIRTYADTDEALALFRKMRKKQYAVIKSLDKTDFEKHAVHKEYSDYSIPIIINHMIFHEYWHMYRIEEICLMKDEFFH
ncbi:MAG: DinB family protein [Spirochaetales bacterium]|nr:DinB family protein [Spirochaetales bacterium]